MSALAKALEETFNNTTTLNGMPVGKSSLDAHVDLFYSFGANRGAPDRVLELFNRAYEENEDLAVRIALHGRDARGGVGEREPFRKILTSLARSGEYYTVSTLIPMVPELGRWDDLFAFVNTPCESEALSFYAQALRNENALAAKWCPREKSAKSYWAKRLREHMGLRRSQYRKMLSKLTDVVENKMCAKQWQDINYSHVPSLAATRYQNAFRTNDGERYNDYVNAIARGESKINAGAVFPHQVIQGVVYGHSGAAEEQWKALPNFIPEGKSFIPMVDVSGSMMCPAGGNSSVSAIDVAIGLGLYCATKSNGAFKNKMLTFTSNPSWIDVSGLSLEQAVIKTRRAEWGMNTDITKAYRTILTTAIQYGVPQSDMPDYFIIFSDMQFDRADSNGINASVKRDFEEAGYEMPRMVYWNLNDYGRNAHVRATTDGSVLVSGFSPSLLTAVLADIDNYSPVNVMLEAVMNERYNWQR